MSQRGVDLDLRVKRLFTHPQDAIGTTRHHEVDSLQLRTRGYRPTPGAHPGPQLAGHFSFDSLDYLGVDNLIADRIEFPVRSHARRICAVERVSATRLSVRSGRGWIVIVSTPRSRARAIAALVVVLRLMSQRHPFLPPLAMVTANPGSWHGMARLSPFVTWHGRAAVFHHSSQAAPSATTATR